MGQYEVLEFLSQHKEQWFDAKEIARLMKNEDNCGLSSITGSLKKLRSRSMVTFKYDYKRYLYKHKV